MEVTFETAKLAKEKGFNEPSTHIYTIGFGGIKEDRTVRKFGNYEDNDKLLQPIILSKGQLHLALAPTQSLLQKWLREKYNIAVLVQFNDNNSFEFYYFIHTDISKAYSNRICSLPLKFNSYEECLEVGLFEGLKLVEIPAKTNKTEENE